MTYASPLSADDEEEIRRKRAKKIVDEGDYVGFEMAFMDSGRPSMSAADQDAVRDAAYRDMCDHLQNAWRQQPASAPADAEQHVTDAAADSPEVAYAQMVTRNCTAWQRRG